MVIWAMVSYCYTHIIKNPVDKPGLKDWFHGPSICGTVRRTMFSWQSPVAVYIKKNMFDHQIIEIHFGDIAYAMMIQSVNKYWNIVLVGIVDYTYDQILLSNRILQNFTSSHV